MVPFDFAFPKALNLYSIGSRGCLGIGYLHLQGEILGSCKQAIQNQKIFYGSIKDGRANQSNNKSENLEPAYSIFYWCSRTTTFNVHDAGVELVVVVASSVALSVPLVRWWGSSP